MSAALITLGTDRSTYRAADAVTLTIVNRTASRYTYNPCTRILERETNGVWSEVREDRMCTMMAHLLDARASQTEQTDLGDNLAPGRYRIVVRFVVDTSATQPADAVRATTAPIQVTP